MAIVVESVSIGAFSTTPLTITKPSGLSVGDLMIWVISGDNPSSTSNPDYAPPAGWAVQATMASSGNNERQIVWSKIATGGDVSATDFSATWLGGSIVGGVILRISGHNPTTPVQTVSQARANNEPIATPIYPITVTPNYANSLLIFASSSFDSSGINLTASGYSIVTDNPIWTERVDEFVVDSANRHNLAVATAPRASQASTGDATVTINTSCDQMLGAMIVINPISTTVSTLGLTTGYYNLTGEDITLSPSVVPITWENEEKNSSLWINKPKHI